VNFERTMIFMTSNLGAHEMQRELLPQLGFQAPKCAPDAGQAAALDKVCQAAVRRGFSPEFVNRIDAIVTYQPLSGAALSEILDQQLADLQRHIIKRLGVRAFRTELSPAGREFLLSRGTSIRYGARELKRTIEKQLMQPLAAMLVKGEIAPGSTVLVEVNPRGSALCFRPRETSGTQRRGTGIRAARGSLAA
jgi:ATP-dependent Clp protease ATP-binding subunit ClpA